MVLLLGCFVAAAHTGRCRMCKIWDIVLGGILIMAAFTQIVEQASDILWNYLLLFLLVGTGIFFTIKLHFVQLSSFADGVRHLFKGFSLHGKAADKDGMSSFQALATAIAAQVGTGNITGCATALVSGGPGALFWTWVSAFFGMATKYAEVVLAMGYRKGGAGGPMYYIERGMGKKWLAVLFAWFAMLASLGIGNMAQVNTIAVSIRSALPRWQPEPLALLTGLAAAVLVGAVTLGGARQVGQVMERLVPMVAVCYLLGSGAVLAAHASRLPAVFSSIFREAFSPRAAIGGGMGAAIRWGVSRGIFSNEAGLGSAPMAHAAADARPRDQGLLGIFEVFLDTVVLCTLTALTILVSGVPVPYGQSAGANLATEALATVFGSHASGMMAVCLSLLALATLVSWQLYGVRCAGYLFGTRGEQIYRLIYLAVIVLGATNRPEVLDKGTVVIGGITQESVQQAAELAIAMQAAGEPRAMPLDYEDVNVGAKVVKLIQSYTPIVNETVWLKR